MRSTSMVAMLAGVTALPAFAQTLPTEEFIGTVTLGESRRAVQTDTAASETTIEAEEIEARQASTMADLLDTVPNVSLLNGATPQGGGVSIRGLGAQAGTYGTDGKIAVVVDGIASGAEEIYRNGSLLVLEPELFRRLTVTRGPSAGFRYSSGAIGGTIEAETKSARDFLNPGDGTIVRQKLGYESNGNSLLSSTILAFAPDDRFDLLTFVGKRRSGITSDGDGMDLPGTGFDQTAFMLKANYQASEATRLTFAYIYNEVPEKDVNYDVYNATPGFPNVDRFTTDTTAFAQINFDPLGNDLINTTARLQFKREQIAMDQIIATPSTFTQADHETRTLSFRLDNVASFSTGALAHELTAGVEFSKRLRSSHSNSGVNDSSAPGGIDSSVALYLADEMTIAGLTLTPQMRFERQILTGQNNPSSNSFGRPIAANGIDFRTKAFTGAIAAKYDITDVISVFGTWAYNENLPVLDDLDNIPFMTQSEKATTREAGLSYDDDVFAAKLAYFKTRISDGTTYRGIDSVDLDGLELEATYASDLFYMDFNASRTRGTVTGPTALAGTHFSYAPADQAQLTLGRKFMNDQLDASVEMTRVAAHDRTSAVSGARAPTEAYTSYDLNLAFLPDQGALDGFEIRAGVENLGDATYRQYGNARNSTGRNYVVSIAKSF